MRQRHPDLSEEQTLRYIQELRSYNDGKLTGLSIPDILGGVEQLMQQHQDGECSICLEDMTHNTHQLPCGHIFHRHCIDVSVQFERFCFVIIMFSGLDVQI